MVLLVVVHGGLNKFEKKEAKKAINEKSTFGKEATKDEAKTIQK